TATSAPEPSTPALDDPGSDWDKPAPKGVNHGSPDTIRATGQRARSAIVARHRPRRAAPPRRSKRLRRHAAWYKYLGAQRFRDNLVGSIDPDSGHTLDT